MKEIAVSVIVPAYNAEATIAETLASALAQTYESLEVIVVDDGSRDRTTEIVEAIAARDERVRLLRQPNRGVAAARNLAIEHARGEYIAPLDADDLWYPEKLEAQVERLKAGGETMGMVYAWTVDVDEGGAALGATPPHHIEGDILWPLVYSNFIGCASVPLIRRSAIEEVGLYEEGFREYGQGCEDWDLYLRLAERYTVGVVPQHLVRYRRAASAMSRKGESMAGSYRAMIRSLQRRQPNLPPELLRWSASNFYAYLAGMSYADWDFRRTLRWLWASLAADPARLLSEGTRRQGVRSLGAIVAAPFVRRLLPSREDWTRYKVGLGGRPPVRYTVEEAVDLAGGLPGAPPTGRLSFQGVHLQRWSTVMSHVKPLQAATGTLQPSETGKEREVQASSGHS